MESGNPFPRRMSAASIICEGRASGKEQGVMRAWREDVWVDDSHNFIASVFLGFVFKKAICVYVSFMICMYPQGYTQVYFCPYRLSRCDPGDGWSDLLQGQRVPMWLSRVDTTCLSRSKCLLISWLQSPSAVILEPPKIKSDTVSTDIKVFLLLLLDFLVAQMVKNLLQYRRPEFSPWVGKIPWRREWLPIPVFLPGEFHG